MVLVRTSRAVCALDIDCSPSRLASISLVCLCLRPFHNCHRTHFFGQESSTSASHCLRQDSSLASLVLHERVHHIKQIFINIHD